MASKEPICEIYTDKRGDLRWRAIGANGKIVADSAEGYKRMEDLRRGMVVARQALSNVPRKAVTKKK